MSIIISPIITNAGLSVFTPLATGIEFTFTHVAVGTGTSAASSADTALEHEIARFPIAGGGMVTGGHAVSINALITNHQNANPQNYAISEFGFYGVDGANNTILFAIHRQSTAIVSKVSGADISAPFVMGLAALPVNNMTVQIDTNASAMLALLGQHTASNHPHTQYKRTLDNSERLKIAAGVEGDDAVSKGQLEAEATTRAGVDSALAGQIAQEVLDRQAGDNNLQTQINNLTLQIMSKAWPIGSVYENSISNLNPADPSLLGFGTWVATQAGRFSVGYQAGDALFGAVGNEGGARGHKMTGNNLIQHEHDRNADGLEESVNVDSSGTVAGSYSPGASYLKLYTKTGKTGLADPDAIPTLPPYHVSYKWIRTA